MMSAAWRGDLEAALGATVVRADPVGGGDINDAFRAQLADGRRVFVKTHRAPPAGMYVAEARGLAWLAGQGPAPLARSSGGEVDRPLRTPQVLAVDERFLALEWLDLDGNAHALAEPLGRGLAALHRLGAPSFGLDHDNFLATIAQDNTPAPDIATFFVERRLRPLVERNLWPKLDALRARPDVFGPPEPPARLHGDLWWGNVAACDGAPVVIDPAVYGGHREIDLAMLALFGGISARFVRAYDEVWPLAEGWRERVPLWQLYPLAAHAVLFGGGYGRRVAEILDALT